MKKWLLIFLGILFLGCGGQNYKLQRVNHMSQIENRNVGAGRTIWISSVKSSFSNESKLEKAFGKSLEFIAQNEFANNGFAVLERSSIGNIMEEYAFSSTLGSNSLKGDFKDSEYTAFVNIVIMQINDNGIWIPIIFSDMDYSMETSVEIKIVDNRTGRVFIKNGSGSVTKNSKNFLLFFGDLNVNLISAAEVSLRLAIRDAILKMDFN